MNTSQVRRTDSLCDYKKKLFLCMFFVYDYFQTFTNELSSNTLTSSELFPLAVTAHSSYFVNDDVVDFIIFNTRSSNNI